MAPPTRHFMRRTVLGSAAAVLLSTTTVAWAQTAWPNQPVKILRAFVTSGTALQMTGEMSKSQTGTFVMHSASNAQPILFCRSGLASLDLSGGSMNAMLDKLPLTIPLPKGARPKALAMTSSQRSAAMPSGITSAQPAAMIEADHKKWAEVVKASGAEVG